MLVETYNEAELTTAGSVDPSEAAERDDLISKLGLKAQMMEGKALEYPCPSAEKMFAIDVLFPTGTKIEDYNAGSIPVRVLKEAAYYRSLHPEHVLVVRHETPAIIKDPVLLAYTDTKYAWQWATAQAKDYRLIARWGDALDSWDRLVMRAREVVGKQARNALDRIIKRAEYLKSTALVIGWPQKELPTLGNIPEGW